MFNPVYNAIKTALSLENYRHSEEAKQKIRESKLNLFRSSKESKEKILAILKKNWVGKPIKSFESSNIGGKYLL